MAYTPPPWYYPIVVESPEGKLELSQPWHIWFLNLRQSTDVDLTFLEECIQQIQNYSTPYRANISGAVSINLATIQPLGTRTLHLTLVGNVSSFALTNPTDGAVYNIRMIQDATGGRTFSGMPSSFKSHTGLRPTYSTAANAVDFHSAQYGAVEGTYMWAFHTATS